MPELQMPDIAGNFLSSYYTAQQKQQADADRQRNMQRQDVADQYDVEDREQAKAARNLDIVARAALSLDTPEKWAAQAPAVMARIGSTGPVPGFDQRDRIISEAQSVTEQLKAKMDERKFRLDERVAGANIRQSDAAADASRASADRYRSGAAAAPTQYQNLNVGGSSTVPAPNPYANLSDDVSRNRLYLQEVKTNEKIREDARAAAMQAQGKIAKVEAFRKMNKETGTGGVYSGPILPGVFQGMGRIVDSNIPNMEAISAELAINTRPPGSGAPSNYDAQMFERATVGIDKPGPANANIAKAISEQARRDIGYSKFVDWYFQTHKTNQGIDQSWQEYADSNPIFDPRAPSAFKLNDSSVNWDQWFGIRKPTSGAAPAATGTPATGTAATRKKTTLPNGVTIEELD